MIFKIANSQLALFNLCLFAVSMWTFIKKDTSMIRLIMHSVYLQFQSLQHQVFGHIEASNCLSFSYIMCLCF